MRNALVRAKILEAVLAGEGAGGGGTVPGGCGAWVGVAVGWGLERQKPKERRERKEEGERGREGEKGGERYIEKSRERERGRERHEG